MPYIEIGPVEQWNYDHPAPDAIVLVGDPTNMWGDGSLATHAVDEADSLESPSSDYVRTGYSCAPLPDLPLSAVDAEQYDRVYVTWTAWYSGEMPNTSPGYESVYVRPSITKGKAETLGHDLRIAATNTWHTESILLGTEPQTFTREMIFDGGYSGWKSTQDVLSDNDLYVPADAIDPETYYLQMRVRRTLTEWYDEDNHTLGSRIKVHISDVKVSLGEPGPDPLMLTPGVGSLSAEWDTQPGALASEIRIGDPVTVEGEEPISLAAEDLTYEFTDLVAEQYYRVEVRSLLPEGPTSWAAADGSPLAGDPGAWPKSDTFEQGSPGEVVTNENTIFEGVDYYSDPDPEDWIDWGAVFTDEFAHTGEVSVTGPPSGYAQLQVPYEGTVTDAVEDFAYWAYIDHPSGVATDPGSFGYLYQSWGADAGQTRDWYNWYLGGVLYTAIDDETVGWCIEIDDGWLPGSEGGQQAFFSSPRGWVKISTHYDPSGIITIEISDGEGTVYGGLSSVSGYMASMTPPQQFAFHDIYVGDMGFDEEGPVDRVFVDDLNTDGVGPGGPDGPEEPKTEPGIYRIRPGDWGTDDGAAPIPPKQYPTGDQKVSTGITFTDQSDSFYGGTALPFIGGYPFPAEDWLGTSVLANSTFPLVRSITLSITYSAPTPFAAYAQEGDGFTLGWSDSDYLPPGVEATATKRLVVDQTTGQFGVYAHLWVSLAPDDDGPVTIHEWHLDYEIGTATQPVVQPHYHRPIRNEAGRSQIPAVVSLFIPGSTDLYPAQKVIADPTGAVPKSNRWITFDGTVDFYLVDHAVVDVHIQPLVAGAPAQVWPSQWVVDAMEPPSGSLGGGGGIDPEEPNPNTAAIEAVEVYSGVLNGDDRDPSNPTSTAVWGSPPHFPNAMGQQADRFYLPGPARLADGDPNSGIQISSAWAADWVLDLNPEPLIASASEIVVEIDFIPLYLDPQDTEEQYAEIEFAIFDRDNPYGGLFAGYNHAYLECSAVGMPGQITTLRMVIDEATLLASHEVSVEEGENMFYHWHESPDCSFSSFVNDLTVTSKVGLALYQESGAYPYEIFVSRVSVTAQ